MLNYIEPILNLQELFWFGTRAQRVLRTSRQTFLMNSLSEGKCKQCGMHSSRNDWAMDDLGVIWQMEMLPGALLCRCALLLVSRTAISIIWDS